MTAINDEFTPQTSWPAIKLGEQSGKLSNLDSWCINIYRGPEFAGAGNSVFTQYLALMNSFQTPITKPLILGEWGTPHTTRPIGVTDNPPRNRFQISTMYPRARWDRVSRISRLSRSRRFLLRSGTLLHQISRPAPIRCPLAGLFSIGAMEG
jgi:hypothetical protein